MAEIRERGLLLRRIAFSETSFVVHLLTAGHGRLSLMARGARRSNSRLRALEPLAMLQLIWRPARVGMGTLAAVERGPLLVPESHAVVALDLISVASSLFREGAGDGFEELCHALSILGSRPEQSGLLAAVWFLLSKTGWVGRLDHCWSCGRQAEALFWSDAQLCCSACGHGTPLSPGLIWGILGHMQSPGVLLPAHETEVWQTMVQDVLHMHGLNQLLVLQS